MVNDKNQTIMNKNTGKLKIFIDYLFYICSKKIKLTFH